MPERETKERPNRILAGAMERDRTAPKSTPTPRPESKLDLMNAVRSLRSRAEKMEVAGINEAAKGISETTRAQYARTIKRRMSFGAGGVMSVNLEEISRASWFPTRAALRMGAANAYQQAMREQDKAQKAGDMVAAGKAVQRALDALNALDAIQKAKAPPAVKVQASARQRLPQAKGETWQAKVYDAATAAMKPAIAVMWATGCRPAELGRGVDVFRTPEGALRVRIPGAKVRDQHGAGQPVRVLAINEKTKAGKALAAVLDGKDKATVKRAAQRLGKDFTDHIRPRLPSSWQITAYSFRHQAAANMKAENGPKQADATARALGHRTTRSQQAYGTAKQAQSGGGVVVLQAGATHKIKETRGIVKAPPAPAPVSSPDSPSLG